MRTNNGLLPKLPGPKAVGTVRAMMRNRQGSGRAAEFPCQSAADRLKFRCRRVGQVVLKLLICWEYLAFRRRISATEECFLPEGREDCDEINHLAEPLPAPV